MVSEAMRMDRFGQKGNGDMADRWGQDAVRHEAESKIQGEPAGVRGSGGMSGRGRYRFTWSDEFCLCVAYFLDSAYQAWGYIFSPQKCLNTPDSAEEKVAVREIS